MRLPAVLLAVLLSAPTLAVADDAGGPRVDGMVWQTAGARCFAWRQGAPANDASAASLVFISFPANDPPFGMSAVMKIDGALHQLRQVAYSHEDRTLSIHYRSLGYRNYDVRLDLGNLTPGEIDGSDLSGALTVSRFGLFARVAIGGSCSANAMD